MASLANADHGSGFTVQISGQKTPNAQPASAVDGLAVASIEHPTSNAPGGSSVLGVRCSMFGVRCSMFDVRCLEKYSTIPCQAA